MKQERHFSVPQLKSLVVEANEEWAIWGRGGGKTSGRIAPRSAKCVGEMRGSLGLMYAHTFSQLLTTTLMQVIVGWERMGYKRDRDYFIGKFAPKKLNWPQPVVAPPKADRFIHWRFGSGIVLASEAAPDSFLGGSYDWLIADEVRKLNKDKMERDLFPTIRGNMDQEWAHHPLHHSKLFCTDMPIEPSALWILAKEEEMDPQLIELIMETHYRLEQLKEQIATDESLSVTTLNKYRSEANSMSKALNKMRANAVFYSEESALSNLEVLTTKYIDQQRRDLSPVHFDAAIRGKRITKIEGGFYPDLKENVHGYLSEREDYVDKVLSDLTNLPADNYEKDGDIDPKQPLYIGPDYGHNFNCAVVGQPFTGEIRALKEFFVYHPKKIRACALKFHNYYKGRALKQVVFIYDHTAIGGDAVREHTYLDEWVSVLEELGWDVDTIFIGHTPAPEKRYIFWSSVLNEEDYTTPRLRINKANCSRTIGSMAMCPVKQVEDRFKKDKSAERDKDFDQADAPHLSDAIDTLVWGIQHHGSNIGSHYSPAIYS